jgi:hypothetical protein
MKKNCWEIMKCGREAGGKNSLEMGACPAFTSTTRHGKNGGKNAGRYCWKTAGTFCGGKVQGFWATKMVSCSACEFFKHVKEQEGQAMAY